MSKEKPPLPPVNDDYGRNDKVSLEADKAQSVQLRNKATAVLLV